MACGAQPRARNTGAYTPNRFAVDYKIDRRDIEIDADIVLFFNQNLSKIDGNFFGTHTSVSPIFSPFMDEEIKLKITQHTRKQLLIGNGIKCITIIGVHILNRVDSTKTNTLH